MAQFSSSLFVSSSVALLLLAAAVVHCDEDRLTPEEVKLVAKFREIVQDLAYRDWMKTDEYLVRWLRARKFNLQAARDLFKEAMDWRKANNIDSILAEDFTDIENEFGIILEGEDKFRHPLVVFNIGSVDVRKLVLAGKLRKLERFVVMGFELAEHVVRDMNAAAEGQNVTDIARALFLIDLHGFSVRQHGCPQCVPFILSILRIYESYYPDRAYHIYTINTPRAFIPLFEIARPFLSEITSNAVELFDSNRDRWKKALLEEVEEDQLPKQYGGTRTVLAKTLGGLKKHHPLIRGVFERAAAENEKKQNDKSV